MESLKKQNEHVSKLEGKIGETEVNEAMPWGITNEKHAMATLVSKIIPMYYPNTTYTEEGCYLIVEKGQRLFVVSPDGSGKDRVSHKKHLAFEFKCPFSGKTFTTDVHFKFPVRYVTQVMLEMRALGVNELVYVCWTPTSSTGFIVVSSHERIGN